MHCHNYYISLQPVNAKLVLKCYFYVTKAFYMYKYRTKALMEGWMYMLYNVFYILSIYF